MGKAAPSHAMEMFHRAAPALATVPSLAGSHLSDGRLRLGLDSCTSLQVTRAQDGVLRCRDLEEPRGKQLPAVQWRCSADLPNSQDVIESVDCLCQDVHFYYVNSTNP